MSVIKARLKVSRRVETKDEGEMQTREGREPHTNPMLPTRSLSLIGLGLGLRVDSRVARLSRKRLGGAIGGKL